MRTKHGIITSAKMTGTVTVTVHRGVSHPLYQKRFRVSKKFLADTNGMDLALGDEVVISECRPLSKRKCFRVTEILKKAPIVSEISDETEVANLLMSKKSKKASSESSASASSPQS